MDYGNVPTNERAFGSALPKDVYTIEIERAAPARSNGAQTAGCLMPKVSGKVIEGDATGTACAGRLWFYNPVLGCAGDLDALDPSPKDCPSWTKQNRTAWVLFVAKAGVRPAPGATIEQVCASLIGNKVKVALRIDAKDESRNRETGFFAINEAAPAARTAPGANGSVPQRAAYVPATE